MGPLGEVQKSWQWGREGEGLGIQLTQPPALYAIKLLILLAMCD